MKTLHLVSACAAIVRLVAILISGTAYARSMGQRYVHALASQLVTVNNTGRVYVDQTLDEFYHGIFQQPVG